MFRDGEGGKTSKRGQATARKGESLGFHDSLGRNSKRQKQ